MKIGFWADFVCPWCYIGKSRLTTALDNFEHSDRSAISWQAFQLHPKADPNPGEKMIDFMARTKNLSPQELGQMFTQVSAVAEEAGISLNLERALAANTLNAHQVIKYTQEHHPDSTNAIASKIFAAHFTHGLDIGSPEVLAQLCVEHDVDYEDIVEKITARTYVDQIRAEQEEAKKLGVTGVPFFTIDDQIAVAGAQPVEVIINALETVWADFSSEDDD